ncbi:MAG: metal-dependent transcriptional regulator [Coriobacteriia bacterium]|nr:metal-dependent transcriptional regulator [Coriobacteriia bacterium]
METLSMSHEDYLEAIVMLGGTTEKSVRSVDIATKLDVSKASVSKALSSLRERGYVVQPYYGDVTLTQEGFDYASKVYERHTLLTAFLTQAVGIKPEVAAREACLMEHAISDESFERWKTYIKHLNLQ